MADPHVVTALIAKRAEISGYVHDLEKRAKTWRARLAHIDEAIRIFSPESDPEAIPPRRTYRRSRYFQRGEFARLCLDALRKADGNPMTTAEIVTGILAAKRLPDDSSLRASLSDKVAAYLRANKSIKKLGTSRDARWADAVSDR